MAQNGMQLIFDLGIAAAGACLAVGMGMGLGWHGWRSEKGAREFGRGAVIEIRNSRPLQLQLPPVAITLGSAEPEKRYELVYKQRERKVELAADSLETALQAGAAQGADYVNACSLSWVNRQQQATCLQVPTCTNNEGCWIRSNV